MENMAVVQVGFKALRTPKGEFKAASPIYLPETATLAAREKAVISAVEDSIAPLVKNYIDTQKQLKARAAAEEDEPELPWWHN